MAEPLNILVIEDSNADFLMVERHLKQNGLSARCRRVDTLEGLKEALAGESWDLVLSDYDVPQLNFLEGLNLVRAALPDLPVIMVTGTVGEEKAVDLLKRGVFDFVLKDNLIRLVPAIQRSFKESEERQARIAAEESMRKSEYRFESIFNGSPIAIVIGQIDDGLIIEANEAYLRLYGYERSEVIGRTVMELDLYVGKEDRDEIVREIREHGRIMNHAVQTRRKSGELMELLYSAEIIELDSKPHLQAMIIDVTEQRRAENALRESEERFQLALRGANDGLWDWNLKSGEMYFSPRWKSMLGYADEELENHYTSWERLFHPEDLEPAQSRLREFLEGSAPRYEVEFRMRHKEGHYVDILSKAFLLNGDRGEPARLVGTHADVTERKKLEQQFRQAQKMEAVGHLAGGVAHDFNNILTAIFGYSQLILNKVTENDPVRKHAEDILHSSERAATLSQSLLAFSRKQEVTLAVIDLGEVIKGFESFLRRLIREDIELKISCAEEPLSALADRGQLEQVIMNLVANARDAMPNGGRLLMKTMAATLDRGFVETHGYGKAGAYALFSITDSGVGMDKETRSHIFEPFFTTKEEGKGTGLGLSMAYGIVKKHDGFINVYSEPGTGTVFKIYLPLVTAAAQADKKEPNEPPPALRGGTETILVCEDDADLRRLTVHVLSHYGYRVIEASDGQDAVEKFLAHQESIDLVYIDAIMPKKNGKVAYREMKAVHPDFKTVFASGYTRDIFEKDNPFDENTIFINKPYSPIDLLAKTRELLDRK